MFNKYIIIAVSIVGVLLILRFFVCNFFYKCTLLNEILKEQLSDKSWRYSQSRTYLLLSILCYYITLGIMTGKALRPNMSVDTKTLEMIVDALQWAILLFAGYSFGNKGLEMIKLVMGYKKGGTNGNDSENKAKEQIPAGQQQVNTPPVEGQNLQQ